MNSPNLNIWSTRRGRQLGYFFARSFLLFPKKANLLSFWIAVLGIVLQLISTAALIYLEFQTSHLAQSLIFAASLCFSLLFLPGIVVYTNYKLSTPRFDLDLIVCGVGAAYMIQLLLGPSFPILKAFLLQTGLFCFFCFRVIEAYLELKNFDRPRAHFLSESFAAELMKRESHLYLKLIAIGLAVAVILSWSLRNRVEWAVIAISCLPFFFPWSSWSFLRLAQLYTKYGLQPGSFSIIHKICSLHFLRFHSLGVLRDTSDEKPDFFFDPSSAWEEDEIKELLRQLVQSSTHPLSTAILNSLGKPKESSWEVENMPYSGLRSQFRTENGKLHEIILSSRQWLSTHEHEFSSEMIRKMTEWHEAGKLSSFVSVDSRVIAGVSIGIQDREKLSEHLSRLKSNRFSLALWSSGSAHNLPTDLSQFNQVEANLLPLERELQSQYWEERIPAQASVLSSWDPREAGLKLVFQKERRQPSGDEIFIYNDQLNSIEHLFREARSFYSHTRQAIGLAIGLAAGVFLASYFFKPLFGVLLLFVAYPLASRRFRTRMSEEIV